MRAVLAKRKRRMGLPTALQLRLKWGRALMTPGPAPVTAFGALFDLRNATPLSRTPLGPEGNGSESVCLPFKLTHYRRPIPLHFVK